MPFAYIGGISPRNEIQPGVAEGAHDENVVSIEPHNEMSYSQKFPKVFLQNYWWKYLGESILLLRHFTTLSN